jgi:nitroimidazol reductase NimA-like FMN-containing flavoprotein (pyridoxamine 5'-phosphate oxidase superfamily)
MELKDHWRQIKLAFDAGIKSSLHCAIATVGADGWPHVTPIGFIFLRDDYSAYYFEEYTKKIPQNLAHNRRVCLMLVNSGSLFWLTSLFKGKFASPPGIRLMGVAGERRPASETEKAAYCARVKRFSKLKGYDLIWRDLNHVREIKLERFEPVVYPVMTAGLWR